MTAHTEPVKVGAPVFHPNLPGQLIPDEVLKNKSTSEFNDIIGCLFPLNNKFPAGYMHL